MKWLYPNIGTAKIHPFPRTAITFRPLFLPTTLISRTKVVISVEECAINATRQRRSSSTSEESAPCEEEANRPTQAIDA